MMPERWTRIEKIFHAAIESEADGRSAFLDEACADDPELRAEVDGLLAVEQRARGFIACLTSDGMDSLGVTGLSGVASGEFAGNERFRIRQKLGSGGFGAVYEAFDVDQNTSVALKTLPQVSAQELARFKHEFRALADLYHPNLVTLYELISDGESWFFTMELVSGVSFRDYARECGIARLRDALKQLVDGVRALHQAGKLHCDLKPSNVLVTPEGRVVILDFGLVTEIDTGGITQGWMAAGTPFYMAPEQIDGAPSTEAADWYSVGVMLYEVLSGSPLFTGRTADVIAQKHRMESVSPASFADDIPEVLAATCCDLLQRDPRVRPSGDELRRRFGSSSRITPGHLFLGRAQELNALSEAFRAVKAKEARVVLVQGDSGIGKTALVTQFLDELRHREQVVVLEGRCHERESVPYKALDSLVDQLCEYLSGLPAQQLENLLPESAAGLAKLFPALLRVLRPARRRDIGFSEPHAMRARAFRGMRELIGRIAASRPVVLFIDDLQWGDLDSGTLLAELLTPPDPPPVLLIGCCRKEDGPPTPLLESLRTVQGMQSLVVGELTSHEAREIAAALLGGDVTKSSDHADSIASASGGNPFLLHRLAAYAYSDSHPLQKEGPDFNSVVGNVVSRLPQDARRLLEVVSVAVRPIDIRVAQKAADLLNDLHGALAPLRGERLIRICPVAGHREIEPYHERIRQSVVHSLAAETLRSCHYCLALAWENSGYADCETLALHFQAAGASGKAGEYAVRAGDQAADALAFDNAARWYRVALDLLSADASDGESALRTKLGDALSNAGRGSEGADEYLLAADQANGFDALELRRRSATQYLLSGHLDRGLTVLASVLSMVGMKLASTPRRALASLVARRLLVNLRGLRFRERKASDVPTRDLIRIDACWSVAQGFGFIDAIRAADFHASHLLYALRAGEKYRVARALAVEAGYSAYSGVRNRRRTKELIDRALELSETCDDPYAVPLVTLVSGIAAFLEGRWRAAVDLHQRAETLLKERCVGTAWELATAHIMSGAAMYFMGDLRALCERLPVLLHDADARGDFYEATALRTRLVHLTALCADNSAAAAEQARRAIAQWPGIGFQIQHWWSLMAEAQTILYSEHSSRALDLWTRAWPDIRRSGILRLQYIRIESLHQRASSALAAASGTSASHRRRLLKFAEADAHRIQKENTLWGDGLAKLIYAGVAASCGRTDQTRELLMAAQTAFEQADMTLFAMVAQRSSGELVGGDKGRALVKSAETWMTLQNIRRPDRMSAMLTAPILSAP